MTRSPRRTSTFRLRPSTFAGISVLATLLLSAAPASASSRALSFEERVQAQEAIERVYHRHLEGSRRPFSEAVPRALLERKVIDTMRQSVALAERWSRPVTGAMLQAELDRITRQTRFPDRLEEIRAALDHDPVLLLECFARPVLVGRLIRGYFEKDQRIHGRPGPRDGRDPAPSALPHGDPDVEAGRTAEWGPGRARDRGEGPATEGGHIREEALRTVLRDASAHGGGDRPSRTSWHVWWADNRWRFDENDLQPVALPADATSADLAAENGATCPPDDVWRPYLAPAPPFMGDFTGVWTGSNLILWGEFHPRPLVFDPLTDSWVRGSLDGAPSWRKSPTGVWDGTGMIVWGGRDPNGVLLGDGARYDPAADGWSPISTSGAPSLRQEHSAVWSGAEMIIWGGRDPDGLLLGDGARYDPAMDTWSPMASSSAPAPRRQHGAVWSGSLMIVWGGRDPNSNGLADGARYDPSSDTWSPVSTTGAPLARTSNATVWAGGRMLVWGGYDTAGATNLDTGGAYDPVSNSWTAMTTTGAPPPMNTVGAVSAGGEMIIWSGWDQPSGGWIESGGRYDPDTDTWAAISPAGSPASVHIPHLYWTGSELIFLQETGIFRSIENGRYDPVSDTWVPLGGSGVPERRDWYTSVWSGNEMIVWGGTGYWVFNNEEDFNTGGRYDPLTDSWTPTTTVGAPVPRVGHVAVWSGDEMIIWGGGDGIDYLPDNSYDTGGRYDPVADSWTPTTTTGAPSPRILPAGVWTGSEMIVWGGSPERYCTTYDDGARYDPDTDSWTPMTTVNPATHRDFFDARVVWTGTDMIVSGGVETPCGGYLLGASRYNPATDTWTYAGYNGGGARESHTAVWTGSEMIIWGGSGNQSPGTGTRYDPATDTWTPVSTAGAPTTRERHTAVWTGSEMIIWGGLTWIQTGPGSWSGARATGGGRYDPVRDRWTAMTLDEPTGKIDFSSVWTGTEMLVWGDPANGTTFDGGIYSMGGGTDNDGDGFSECDGDCYDGDPNVYPGAPEICDLEDSDCDGFRPADEIDEDGDGWLLCAPDCDDTDPDFYPGAPELCDGLDNDCDLSVPFEEIDADGDGVPPCADDCNDGDPTVIMAPAEVGNVEAVVLPGGPRLTWDDQAGWAGSSTTYDVFTGGMDTVRYAAGDFASGSCAMQDGGSALFDDPGADPPPGGVVYFLIRAQNSCGGGTWGDLNRDTTAANSAGPCM